MLPPYVPSDKITPGKDLIHYAGPVWDSAEITAATKALTEGKWLPSGERVREFEVTFSRMFGHSASLMVNSGSSANLVMLSALKKHYGWRSGDEVIVSVVGFPTTVAPVLQCGLTPVFCDIELQTLNFDLQAVEDAITDNTKAIFVSPVLANPPDFDRLEEISRKYSVTIILDGCDSLGSKWRSRPISNYAVATSCSFYPAHHITTGEGGMVSSRSSELIKLARKFAWWGRDCYCVGAANSLERGSCGNRFAAHLGDAVGTCDHKYVFSEIGFNLKPLDLQGAIGLEQLKKFPFIHEGRRCIKQRLTYFLAEHRGDLFVPIELKHAETGWFGIPIVCPDAETKQKLVTRLESRKIQTRNYFAGNLLLHPGYSHLGKAADYPNANEVLSRVFFIGCHPTYSEETLQWIEQTFLPS